jgi:hypothetical protein
MPRLGERNLDVRDCEYWIDRQISIQGDCKFTFFIFAHQLREVSSTVSWNSDANGDIRCYVLVAVWYDGVHHISSFDRSIVHVRESVIII